MIISLANHNLPTQFYETEKHQGSTVYNGKSFMGVTGKLTESHDYHKTRGGSSVGYLDPNCTPWDLEIRRREFLKHIQENEIVVKCVSVVEVVISAQTTKTQGLKVGVFTSNHLDVTIAAIGDGKVKVTTMCYGPEPLQLHIETWRALVAGTWKA